MQGGYMDLTEARPEARTPFEATAFELLKALLDLEKSENEFRACNRMPSRFLHDAGLSTDQALKLLFRLLKSGELQD